MRGGKKKWFLGLKQRDESYHLNTDSLSYLTDYEPKMIKKEKKKRRNSSLSLGTESLSCLQNYTSEKYKGREKDILRILRREGTMDNFKNDPLDSSVDGSLVNLTPTMPQLSKARNPRDRTHDVLIRSVLRFIAQEPKIKPKKFTKTGVREVTQREVMRVNLRKLDETDPDFQITRPASVSDPHITEQDEDGGYVTTNRLFSDMSESEIDMGAGGTGSPLYAVPGVKSPDLRSHVTSPESNISLNGARSQTRSPGARSQIISPDGRSQTTASPGGLIRPQSGAGSRGSSSLGLGSESSCTAPSSRAASRGSPSGREDSVLSLSKVITDV